MFNIINIFDDLSENYTYKELKYLLIKASNSYYIDNNPIMSDYEFDMKMKELEAMEAEQGFADPDSPTQKVGSDLTSKNSRKHARPMLSLENTYNMEDVEKWYSDMERLSGIKNPIVVVNEKWDGGSCAIHYKDGKISNALSRGNGIEGEDITQNVSLLDINVNFTGEVRGELLMTKSGFINLNKDNKYQNARNLLSGSMKLLNPEEFKKRADAIRFYAYWAEDSFPDSTSYSEDLKKLEESGFYVGPYYVCKSLEEVKSAIRKIERANNSDKFEVEIDGAVMKIDDKTLWNTIGSTAKAPRWARAYKYKQKSVSTKILSIEFWVGRTGKITPVAWFEPKFLDGSTVQKATLNNKEFYDAMDISIGDTVEVQKAAAIIPQIISVKRRPFDRKSVRFPTKCPNCGTTLIKKNEEHNDYYCLNPNCSARRVDQIINYTHMMEIDGFAEVIVERLSDAGFLSNVESLYDLKNYIKGIAKLDRLSENLANKLVQNIENSKNNDFWKLLAALGISNVGPKTAKDLAKHFKSMKVLSGATKLELMDVEGIGEVVADSIILWFKNAENKKLVKRLEVEGQMMTVEIKDGESSSQIDLSGKTFCITGELSLPRDRYIDLIETCGGRVVSGVSKKLSYLITNDRTTNTTKNVKAREYGIPILNEEEILTMCDGLNLLKELEYNPDDTPL